MVDGRVCVHTCVCVCPDLEIPINQPVGFKVIVVFAKWIYQLFSHLKGRPKLK